MKKIGGRSGPQIANGTCPIAAAVLGHYIPLPPGDIAFPAMHPRACFRQMPPGLPPRPLIESAGCRKRYSLCLVFVRPVQSILRFFRRPKRPPPHLEAPACCTTSVASLRLRHEVCLARLLGQPWRLTQPNLSSWFFALLHRSRIR